MELCDHPGCLNHKTHPCEKCGRTAGKLLTVETIMTEWLKENGYDGLYGGCVGCSFIGGGSLFDCFVDNSNCGACMPGYAVPANDEFGRSYFKVVPSKDGK